MLIILHRLLIELPADNAGKLAKIAEQKWIALFSVAVESYLDLRRTKMPDIFDNGNLSTYEFPVRFRYPGNESGQNRDAYDLVWQHCHLLSMMNTQKSGCCNKNFGVLF